MTATIIDFRTRQPVPAFRPLPAVKPGDWVWVQDDVLEIKVRVVLVLRDVALVEYGTRTFTVPLAEIGGGPTGGQAA